MKLWQQDFKILIELKLSCRNLTFYHSPEPINPLVYIFGKYTHEKQYRFLSQTEQAENTRNPEFRTKIPITYRSASPLTLKFNVYSPSNQQVVYEHEMLGHALVDLRDVVKPQASYGAEFNLDLKPRKGITMYHSMQYPAQQIFVQWSIAAASPTYLSPPNNTPLPIRKFKQRGKNKGKGVDDKRSAAAFLRQHFAKQKEFKQRLYGPGFMDDYYHEQPGHYGDDLDNVPLPHDEDVEVHNLHEKHVHVDEYDNDQHSKTLGIHDVETYHGNDDSRVMNTPQSISRPSIPILSPDQLVQALGHILDGHRFNCYGLQPRGSLLDKARASANPHQTAKLPLRQTLFYRFNDPKSSASTPVRRNSISSASSIRRDHIFNTHLAETDFVWDRIDPTTLFDNDQYEPGQQRQLNHSSNRNMRALSEQRGDNNHEIQGYILNHDDHKIRPQMYADGVIYWCTPGTRDVQPDNSLRVSSITNIVLGRLLHLDDDRHHYYDDEIDDMPLEPGLESFKAKRNLAYSINENRCFTIVTDTMTLGLEAVTNQEARIWALSILTFLQLIGKPVELIESTNLADEPISSSATNTQSSNTPFASAPSSTFSTPVLHSNRRIIYRQRTESKYDQKNSGGKEEAKHDEHKQGQQAQSSKRRNQTIFQGVLYSNNQGGKDKDNNDTKKNIESGSPQSSELKTKSSNYATNISISGAGGKQNTILMMTPATPSQPGNSSSSLPSSSATSRSATSAALIPMSSSASNNKRRRNKTMFKGSLYSNEQSPTNDRNKSRQNNGKETDNNNKIKIQKGDGDDSTEDEVGTSSSVTEEIGQKQKKKRNRTVFQGKLFTPKYADEYKSKNTEVTGHVDPERPAQKKAIEKKNQLFAGNLFSQETVVDGNDEQNASLSYASSIPFTSSLSPAPSPILLILEMKLKCKNLSQVLETSSPDVIRRFDSQIGLFQVNPGTQFCRYLDYTDVVKQCCEPQFPKCFRIRYCNWQPLVLQANLHDVTPPLSSSSSSSSSSPSLSTLSTASPVFDNFLAIPNVNKHPVAPSPSNRLASALICLDDTMEAIANASRTDFDFTHQPPASLVSSSPSVSIPRFSRHFRLNSSDQTRNWHLFRAQAHIQVDISVIARYDLSQLVDGNNGSVLNTIISAPPAPMSSASSSEHVMETNKDFPRTIQDDDNGANGDNEDREARARKNRTVNMLKDILHRPSVLL